MAQIHQYVYTRLPKERSPRGKHGFQSAFLPEAWNERGFILELESRIHFPEYDTFSEKNVVFYRELGDQPHLIMMWMRLLPDLRDEQGRGGIFLVHGFIVPPELHTQVRRPMALMKMLEPHLFLDIEDVMSSPLADKETALIAPIELSLGAVKKAEKVESTGIVKWERQLLSFLFKQLRGEMDDWTLAIKGEPQKVQQAMDRLSGFLPQELQVKMGWDPAFDGGKVFFSPFKSFGYSKAEPVTGRPLFFDLENETLMDSSLSHVLLMREHPFDRFLEVVLEPDTSMKAIEEAYLISMSLHEGKGVPEGHQLEGRFAEAIRELAGGYFEELANEQVPRQWAMVMRQALDLDTICQTLNARMSTHLVTIGLERTIISQAITPEKMGEALPPELVEKGPPRLKLLNTMWTQKAPSTEMARSIPPNSLRDAFRLMATTRLLKKTWFFQLLSEFPPLFHSLLINDKEFSDKAGKWMVKQVPRAYRPVRSLLVDFMMESGNLSELSKEKPDWNHLLEQLLSDGKYDRKDLKAVVETISNEGFNDAKYPLLHAFAFPENKIPGIVGMHKGRRERFAQAMVVCHNLGKKALRDMGFSDPEIAQAVKNRRGIVGLIRNILGQ